MNIFGFGKAVESAGKGVSTAAESIRFALTGDLPPEERIRLEELLIRALEIEAKLKERQIDLSIVDAKSTNIFKSGWRPMLGWISVLGFSLVFVFFPIMEWSLHIYMAFSDIALTTEQRLSLAPPSIDANTLLELLLGMLGLGGLRTYEKLKGITK